MGDIMKKYLIFLILISLILISSCTQDSQDNLGENNGVVSNKGENKINQDAKSDEIKDVQGYKGELIAGSTTPYIRYSKEDFDKAKAEGKIIYLYFYATWCPICAAERPSIFKAFEEMSYNNVIGFEVHFNDAKTNKEDEDLAKELGIAYQHTTIIFDKNGNEAYRSLSKISKDKIKEEIFKLV